jgi:hypothetical protein
MQPTPAEIWLERLDRAGGLTAPAVRDLYHELLDVDDVVESSERGQRRLWTEIGRRLGLDAPPDDLFDSAPDSKLDAGGPKRWPPRSEYPRERR